jgi:predicted Zn-dependent peptidase
MRDELADFLRFCAVERRLAPLTCAAYERDVLACRGYLEAQGVTEFTLAETPCEAAVHNAARVGDTTLTQELEGEVRCEDRDGVPVFWAEAPEPFVGALLFRVGRADETLRDGGLTHLVEHLALSRIGRRPYEYNAVVDATVTGFYVSGTRDEVLPHFAEVTAGLRELPLDRIKTEKRILTTEAQSAGADVHARLLSLRFGAVGYGLVHQGELGLEWLTSDRVGTWAGERFTGANAAVWLTGKPPEHLEIVLPAGSAHPPPPPEPIPSLALPSYLADGSGGVAVSVTSQRSTAIHAAFLIALERARARLRRDAGLSYAPVGWYAPLDGRVAHIVMNADCKDQEASRVRDELLRILDDLAEHGPTEDELEWDRTMLDRQLRDPNWAHSMLDARVRDSLAGVESPTRADLLRERAELTSDAVGNAVAQALTSLLVLVPTGVPMGGHRHLTAYAPENKELVDGRRYRVTKEWQQWKETSELVVGESAFSYLWADRTKVMSWKFDECVAGIRLLSGALTVVGRDGSSVTIYPHRYEGGFEALHTIENALGEKRLVPTSDRGRELAPIIQEELGARVGRIAAEIDLLPNLLAETEELRRLAEARRGNQVGLLGVTDRRLLFLFWGLHEKELFEKALDEISDVTVKGLLQKRLVVTDGSEMTEFQKVQPEGRLGDIVRLLSAS